LDLATDDSSEDVDVSVDEGSVDSTQGEVITLDDGDSTTTSTTTEVSTTESNSSGSGESFFDF
jgi:hypothetical protein